MPLSGPAYYALQIFFFTVESLKAVSLHRGGVQLCKDCAACITFRNFFETILGQVSALAPQPMVSRVIIELTQSSWAGAGTELGKNNTINGF